MQAQTAEAEGKPFTRAQRAGAAESPVEMRIGYDGPLRAGGTGSIPQYSRTDAAVTRQGMCWHPDERPLQAAIKVAPQIAYLSLEEDDSFEGIFIFTERTDPA